MHSEGHWHVLVEESWPKCGWRAVSCEKIGECRRRLCSRSLTPGTRRLPFAAASPMAEQIGWSGPGGGEDDAGWGVHCSTLIVTEGVRVDEERARGKWLAM